MLYIQVQVIRHHLQCHHSRKLLKNNLYIYAHIKPSGRKAKRVQVVTYYLVGVGFGVVPNLKSTNISNSPWVGWCIFFHLFEVFDRIAFLCLV